MQTKYMPTFLMRWEPHKMNAWKCMNWWSLHCTSPKDKNWRYWLMLGLIYYLKKLKWNNSVQDKWAKNTFCTKNNANDEESPTGNTVYDSYLRWHKPVNTGVQQTLQILFCEKLTSTAYLLPHPFFVRAESRLVFLLELTLPWGLDRMWLVFQRFWTPNPGKSKENIVQSTITWKVRIISSFSSFSLAGH